MRQALRYLFTIQQSYSNPLDQQRAQAVLVFIWFAVIFWLLWVVATVMPSPTMTVFSLLPVGVTIAILGVAIVAFSALKNERLIFASNLLVYASVVAAIAILFILPRIDPRYILGLILPLGLASVLFNRTGILTVGTILSAFIVFTSLLGLRTFSDDVSNPFSIIIQLILMTVLTTVIFSLYTNRQQRITETSVADFERLRDIVETVTRITPDTTEAEILQRAIRFLRGTFDYDVVRIYLLDEERNFSQRIRAGERIVENLPKSERFRLGDASAIAEAGRLQRAISVIAGSDSVNRTKHLLPSIRQGVVIPITHDGVSLGVIDMQRVDDSLNINADIQLISILAAELGAVLMLLKHIGSMNRELIEQTENAKRLQSQLTGLLQQQQQVFGIAWSDYIQQSGHKAIGFNLRNGEIREANDMPKTFQEAIQRGEMFSDVQGDQKTIYVPIKMREDVLGAMTFVVPADQHLTDRQRELVTTVADRLGSTLESTRLLEQTRAQAMRERKATEVGNSLLTATDVNALLQLAAETFNDALGAVQTQIYVEPRLSPSFTPDTTNGNGDRA